MTTHTSSTSSFVIENLSPTITPLSKLGLTVDEEIYDRFIDIMIFVKETFFKEKNIFAAFFLGEAICQYLKIMQSGRLKEENIDNWITECVKTLEKKVTSTTTVRLTYVDSFILHRFEKYVNKKYDPTNFQLNCSNEMNLAITFYVLNSMKKMNEYVGGM